MFTHLPIPDIYSWKATQIDSTLQMTWLSAREPFWSCNIFKKYAVLEL